MNMEQRKDDPKELRAILLSSNHFRSDSISFLSQKQRKMKINIKNIMDIKTICVKVTAISK
jgi:hypothetical protein